MLNYLYKLLEVETSLACTAAGLDVTLDLAPLHVDKPYRRSLPATLMEPGRGAVDRWLLGYLGRRTFALREVVEARDGQVTLMPSITHELMETLPIWREAIGPVVQAVVESLIALTDFSALARSGVNYSEPPAPSPTPFPAPRRGVQEAPANREPVALISRLCGHCGAVSDARYCSEQCSVSAATLHELGGILADTARRTPEAWQALWPHLRALPLPRLMAACRRSRAWASRVRSGGLVPSSETWPQLCRACKPAP